MFLFVLLISSINGQSMMDIESLSNSELNEIKSQYQIDNDNKSFENEDLNDVISVSYTHLRAHET